MTLFPKCNSSILTPPRMWAASLVLLATLPFSPHRLCAQTCDSSQLATAIDSAGEQLRKLTNSTQPQLQAKLLRLKQVKGWSDQEYQEKGYAALEDARTAVLDSSANELLARLDHLGGDTNGSTPDCARIAEVESVSLELQATIRAKSKYVLNRLDQLSGDKTASEQAVPATPPQANARLPEKPNEAAGNPAGTAPANLPKSSPPQTKPDARWATQTKSTPLPPPAPAPPAAPPALASPPVATTTPPQIEPEGYTIDEIVAASSGVFGKVSANLARVLEHAFAQSGRPSAYILGQETGGAFVAGVRYGSGRLYLRSGGNMQVYWHGPSLGADIGAQGAQILFLVYKMRQPEDVFSNFTGIEGSAFVVGGLGVTYMSNGRIGMAPIRSGIGLRLGANIGYIRFTSTPTWNPF